MGNIPGADERIARILGQKQGHPITITHGSEVHENPRVGNGQIDANVPPPSPRQQQLDRAAERSAAADTITMPDPTPDPADAVVIGNVTIRPQTLTGWEAQFTKGGNDSHVVTLDGEQIIGSAALGAVYTALREQSRKGKKSA